MIDHKTSTEFLFERRRLLRFTASIANIGKADFRSNVGKSSWIWHSCHRHFHSMEVFAHFDLLDFETGSKKLAEGHKASFCLEDNECMTGYQPKYKCAEFGDQGISVGCRDTYAANIDCQWIDITDLDAGLYRLKVSRHVMPFNPDLIRSLLNPLCLILIAFWSSRFP